MGPFMSHKNVSRNILLTVTSGIFSFTGIIVIGQMSIVFANGPEDRGSILGRVIP